MLTWRYSRQAPTGEIFDTEGRQYPFPPSELNGWFDTPAKLHLTRDDVIEAVVRAELAKQPLDRDKLEAEFVDKTGDRPHFAAKEETLVKVLDDSHAKERKREKKSDARR